MLSSFPLLNRVKVPENMAFPLVTSIYAALLALLFAVLTIWVSAGRTKYRVFFGDGGNPDLNQSIRAHGNFAEYVPLILLLVSFLEERRTSIFIVHALLLTLLVARVMHPIGLVARERTVAQGVFRGFGAGATLLVLIVAAVILLVSGLTTPRY